MRDIRVYDFDFNLLCIMTDVVSSQWHILYNDVGSFEGHFRLNDRISDVILSHNYIVITQGEKQAICTGKIVEDELIVCGRTVNWILSKRVRPPFKTKDIFGEEYTDPETILLYCLKKGLTEPCQIDDDGFEIDNTIDNNKKICNFVLPEPIGAHKLTTHFWRITANELTKLCKDLCDKLDRGYRVIFDIENKQWVFEFIYPKENGILISKESRTAYNFNYTVDLLDYASGGWYYVEDSDTDDSKSKWHYKKREEKTGIYAWDCVLSGSGESEAEDNLSKKVLSQKVEAKLRSLRFGKDYELGDIIKVYVKFGNFEKLSSYKITGVDIKITSEDSYEEPIFKQI